MTEAAATPAHAAAPAIEGRFADPLLALFVGGAAFLAIVGPQVLDVTNMLWLAQTQDGFTHYLGWEFFRRSPWAWPPGLNPDYGLQFSSSIIFSDSVPLLALLLKPFSALMPAVFQYTGWWILACFVLQAWFSVRIAGLFTRSILIKLGLAALLSFAPPMLWRLSIHYSLIPHWIILAALYLYFAPAVRRRWLHWALLLGASALIHTYLFAMCGPIWLASLLRRHLVRDGVQPHWLLEIAAVVAVPVLALALGGFFPLRSDMLGGGYGFFRMNVFSLFNPDGAEFEDEHWLWSALLPMLPHGPGDYEGFAYAGLGMLAALVLALPLLWTERRSLRGTKIWPLALVAVLLTLFALSPNLAIGAYGIEIPFPEPLMDLAGAMRSSGRFFWPVYYLLAIGAVWLLHKGMGDRVTGVVLLLVAGLQIYDTSPGWSSLRSQFELAGNTLPTPLDDAELAAVAAHYNAVRTLPIGNKPDNWQQIAWFALRNGKPTDAVYLARPDVDGYAAYRAGIDAAIAGHRLESDSLYFVSADYAARISQHMTAEDAMFKIGEFFIFAPGWARFGAATDLPTVEFPIRS